MTKRTLPVVPAPAGSQPVRVSSKTFATGFHGLQSVSPQHSMQFGQPIFIVV
ncbi:hypothetical protein [Ralstonia sp. UNC404CL21Col]|uniref:hypothetical protein n=1 Tax=Ralstonia sp. UNC404CL21Col TaxID=1380362 RepID=UPI0012DFC5D0|nr:hypothetical protein [Ralstonia sp. UNC404CL21Col]